MKEWYKLSIAKLAEIVPGETESERIRNAFDLKYGDYDYAQDARIVCRNEFQSALELLLDIQSHHEKSKVVIVGANSGYEIEFFSGLDIVALDISKTALSKLRSRFPHVRSVHGDMEELPFDSNVFDIYVNLRSIQSRHINLLDSLKESIRVLKIGGQGLISVPTGYLGEGSVIKGLWDSRGQIIDSEEPRRITKQITDSIKELLGIEAKIYEIPSEILISFKK